MESPVKIKIEHTYDYNKFKLVGVNRQVINKHVISISEAIMYRNLLHLFPVIINSKWEVMDGQHRLAAVKHIEETKKTKLPIYYVLDNEIEIDDMRLLNSNKINWKNQDYINYYAAKRVKPFIDLVKFQKDHPILSLSTCIEIVSSRKRNLSELKSGILLVDKLDKAYLVMKYIGELRHKMDSQIPIWKSRDFINAMRDIVDTGKYQHKILMSSTRNSPDMWNRQFSKRSYVFEINCTYNHSLTEKEKIDFLKLIKP